MSINLSQRCRMAEELEIQSSALTGGFDLIGVLEENPVHIVFDNQSDEYVGIADDVLASRGAVWKTFEPGEAIILDMRANHGIADNMTFSKGMGLYAVGTAGTGAFRISLTYAMDGV